MLFLSSRDPEAEMGGVTPSESFSFDVLDSYGVESTSLSIFVNGIQAYDGASGWISPFDGYVGNTVVDGYSGFHVRIDHSSYSASTRVELHILASSIDSVTFLDETYGFWIATTVTFVSIGPFEVCLSVGFSGALDTGTLDDASLFSISNGAYVRKIDIISNDSILLWVEGMNGNPTFTLTMSDILDIHGFPVEFSGASVYPGFSEALVSGYNGLVRSWQQSLMVEKDIQRAFLMGIRGLDIFDIQSTSPTKWGQILDSYGIYAACLNGDGYSFSDSDSPRISDMVPASGAVVLAPDTIRFLISDITSVEISSLIVSVNSVLVFGGAAGWANGWGGQIEIFPQGLSVVLYPVAGFFHSGDNALIEVRASDFSSNVMDAAYSFTIL